jgi:lysophospholipase L1-like esterase
LSFNPSAKYYLVLYGTNDSDTGISGTDPPVTAGSYRDNMQRIISAIRAAGKLPYLAKVPYSSSPRNSIASIQEYNTVIDELVAANQTP